MEKEEFIKMLTDLYFEFQQSIVKQDGNYVDSDFDFQRFMEWMNTKYPTKTN